VLVTGAPADSLESRTRWSADAPVMPEDWWVKPTPCGPRARAAYRLPGLIHFYLLTRRPRLPRKGRVQPVC